MARSQTVKRGQAENDPDLVRFGISIPADLLKKFDEHLKDKNNQNRSEAIRDLIRDRLVQDSWSEGKGEQIATVTLVYDAQSSDVLRRIQESKRAMGTHLISGMQVRVGTRQDMEILALRGPAHTIRSEAESLLGAKGILHGKLVMTTGS